jgi:uncharacterized RDD family membrane protein YckC
MQWLCPKCGTANGEVSGICSNCFEVKSPEAKPTAQVADSAGTAGSPIPSGAGFGIRFLARLIDLIYGQLLGLVAGIAAGILFVILSRLGRLTPEWPQLIQQHPFSGFGWGLLGAFLYYAVAEGLGTVTIRKLVCGLRVVQIDGGPATIKGALIRDLGFYIDALFFGLVGLASMGRGPLQQRYGDVWGKTVVVKTSVFRPQPGRSVWWMIAGLLIGSVLWLGILFGQLVLKVM